MIIDTNNNDNSPIRGGEGAHHGHFQQVVPDASGAPEYIKQQIITKTVTESSKMLLMGYTAIGSDRPFQAILKDERTGKEFTMIFGETKDIRKSEI